MNKSVHRVVLWPPSKSVRELHAVAGCAIEVGHADFYTIRRGSGGAGSDGRDFLAGWI